MDKYMAVWYDWYQMVHVTFEAESLPDAKHKAFKMMCDRMGDSLVDVYVYKLEYMFDCRGEYNPRETSSMSEYSRREYETGRVVRRAKKIKTNKGEAYEVGNACK